MQEKLEKNILQNRIFFLFQSVFFSINSSAAIENSKIELSFQINFGSCSKYFCVPENIGGVEQLSFFESAILILFFDFIWQRFFAKILSNFVSLPWKLHNRYCHTRQKNFSSSSTLFFSPESPPFLIPFFPSTFRFHIALRF